MTPAEIRKLIAAETAGWSDAQRQALQHKLMARANRARIARLYNTPGKLAQYVDPTTVQTPALDVIDEALEWALDTRDARLLITMPPQEGKSTRVSVWGGIRALVKRPEWRVVLTSYAESLAQEHSRTARNIIREHGSEARDPMTGIRLPDKLGLALSADKGAAGHWSIKGHRGGMYVAGIEGGITGRAADLILIDDPIKGMEEADSAAIRARVITFYQSVALTRRAPGAPIILVQTRWHEGDLAGFVLEQDKLAAGEGRWRHVNIPAVSDGITEDALGRPPGVYMDSARGRTQADWDNTREEVGPRVWGALYMGRPTPTGGGLFSLAWFDRYRLQEPGTTVARLVSVDPAETGRRDEAGVLGIAGTDDGRVLVTDDRSGRMTSEQWARAAVILALEIGAGEVLYEAYMAEQTYRRVLRQAWRDVRDQVRLVRAAGGDVTIAATAWATLEDAPDDTVEKLQEVAHLRVPAGTDPPFTIRPIRGKGDKVARAAGARQAASTGRLRMVGTHEKLEGQAASWQQGHKDSPDRMDALSHGYNRMVQMMGGKATIATPGDVADAQAQTGTAPQAGTLMGGMAALLGAPLTPSDRA